MALSATIVVILYVIVSVLCVGITLAWTLFYHHLHVYPPLLGHLGDKPLESTIFTQFFVWDAALLVLVIHIRFVYVSHYLNKENASRHMVLANAVGTWFGHGSALALFVLACFQMSHAFYIHTLAFFLFFLGGVIYFVIQAFVSVVTKARKCTIIVRYLLSGGLVIMLLLFFVGYAMGLKYLRFDSNENFSQIAYIIGATAQWILFLQFQLYVISYVMEFQQVMLTRTRIVVVPKEGD